MVLITSGGGVPDLPSLFEFYSEPEGKVSKAEFPSMAGLIQELENELQVFVIWDNCETLKIDALIEFIDKNTEIELSDQEMTFLRDVQRDINTYDPLGVGYHYEDALTVGKIVFGYDSAETATSDLPFRERLAARSSFSLDDIKSDGPNLILDVTNTNPAPTSFDWWPGSYRSTNYGLFLCP